MNKASVLMLLAFILASCGDSAERTPTSKWKTISTTDGLVSIDIPEQASQQNIVQINMPQEQSVRVTMHPTHRFMEDNFYRLLLTVEVMPLSKFKGQFPETSAPDNHFDETIDHQVWEKWHNNFHAKTSIFRTMHKDEYRKDYRTMSGAVIRARVQYTYEEFDTGQQVEDRATITRMIDSMKIKDEKAPNQAL